MKRNFLVVAANEEAREALARDLRARGYSVAQAATGAEARRVVSSVSVDAVLIESHLSDTTAEKLRSRLRKVRPDCSVVLVTSFDRVRNTPEQLRFGAENYLLDGEQLTELVGSSLEAEDHENVPSFDQRGNRALIQVIDVLVGLLELEDNFFGGSSHKTMELAREVAVELSAGDETVQAVVLAALLRDVGKVGVDLEAFAHEGTLTQRQRERMREHVSASLRLFEDVDFPWMVNPIIRHHHERYDGTGYPDGLAGREIPLGARIIAVVDAYVALTSDRPHRPAVEPELALQKLIRQAGRQFDPEVVEFFQKVLNRRLEERRPQRKPRVLLVDPQDEFRKMMKMRLLNEDLEVQETDNRNKAMKLLLKDPPDIVVADVGGDGAEAFGFLDEIRQDEKLRRVPYVLLSRASDRVLKMRALRHGVDDFLCKSDDLEELVARVENILMRETWRREGTARSARRGITGELENLSLPDIVQTLVMGMKSARVSISSNEQQGKIWFEGGAAVHAETGGLEGEEAFFEIVRWTSGEFVIEHGVTTRKKKKLKKDTMFLLMEGLRLMDEKAQAVS